MDNNSEEEVLLDNEKPILVNYDQSEEGQYCMNHEDSISLLFCCNQCLSTQCNTLMTTQENEERKLKKKSSLQRNNSTMKENKKKKRRIKFSHHSKASFQRKNVKQQKSQEQKRIKIKNHQDNSQIGNQYQDEYRGNISIVQSETHKNISQQNQLEQDQRKINKKTKNKYQTEIGQEKTKKVNSQQVNKRESVKIKKKTIKKKDYHNYLQAFIKNFIKKYKSQNYKGVDWLIKQGQLIKKKLNISYKRYHLKQLQDQCLETNNLAQTYLNEVFKEKIMDQAIHDRLMKLLKKRI